MTAGALAAIALAADNRPNSTGATRRFDNEVTQTTGTLKTQGQPPERAREALAGRFLTNAACADGKNTSSRCPPRVQRGPDGRSSMLVKPDRTVAIRRISLVRLRTMPR